MTTLMGHIRKVRSRSLFMGGLMSGEDLLEAITLICRENNVRFGSLQAIGADEKDRLGGYDQEKKEDEFFSVDTPCEITSLPRNVSTLNGATMVHAHVTLADRDGAFHGGHLAPENKVFAGEIVIEEFDGPQFRREFDNETGLPLWQE